MESDVWWLSKAESKEVLERISKGMIDDDLISILGGEAGLADRLSSLYEEYKVELLRTKLKPDQFKNLPFYSLIQKKINTFNWQTITSANGKRSVVVNGPRRGGKIPSLSTMVIYPERTVSWSQSDRYDRAFENSLFNKDEIDDIKSTFQLKPFRALSETSMLSLVDTLNNARKQNKLTIFSPVCPDYSHIRQPDGRFMYTFKSIGSGVGLVGERLIKNLPPLYRLARRLEIECEVVIGLGDFEGFDQENLRRLGVNEKSFMASILSSGEKILDRLEIPASLQFIAGLNGTKRSWDDSVNVYACKLEATSKQDVAKCQAMIDVVASRKNLYDKWFGENDSLDSHLPALFRQGAEYSLMSQAITNSYVNPIVVGFDHYKMEMFYSEYFSIPVIYTDCIYL